MAGLAGAIPTLNPWETNHVFVAHSSDDMDVATAVTTQLEMDGFQCFLAHRDIGAGHSIVNAITRGIQESRRVILIISPSFLKSDWLVFEATQAMCRMYEEKQMLLLPVLYNLQIDDVPTYLKTFNCLEYDDNMERDPHFFSKLRKGIVEEFPISATIPAGQVAHGLAWSYFYGFLNLILPGLSDRVHKFKEGHYWNKDPEKRRTLAKLIIILPKSCLCPNDIYSVDSNITFETAIPYTACRAGNKDRDFKSNLYKVQDPESGEFYYFLCEFATPMMALYEMEMGKIAGLDNNQKFLQMKIFNDKLNEILNHPQNRQCHNKALTLEYEDGKADENPHLLSQCILEAIKFHLKIEEQMHLSFSEEMEWKENN